MKRFLPLLLFLLAFPAGAQQYKYRVYLADKAHNAYSLKHPEAFLSQKSIERRQRLRLRLDRHDLPVSERYLAELRSLGAQVCHVSKWNNTAVVLTHDSLLRDRLRSLSFVDSVRLVWRGNLSAAMEPRDSITEQQETTADFYGRGRRQAEMIGADRLHEAGFRGRGLTIAVIDGGFHNADRLAGLRAARILGTRNFVRPAVSVYDEGSHGTNVLSCIAANVPHVLVGTAPEAAFYLLVSEDGASESLVEEDNWCAAAEYADSLGCDIITSSLGYYHFDDTLTNHTYRELDGRTALNSRAASLAASRGLLVLNSAGNSGDNRWKKIGFPADAHDILSVGAVDGLGGNAEFSSLGNTADGRVKPDVMAMGYRAQVFDTTGEVISIYGTSFSTPILCGGVACLWQAFPHKRPVEIIEAVRRSGSNASHPDNVFGYGIPDLWKAYQLLKR